MRLFDALGRSDYQDCLRAVGRYLDSREAHDLRLVEQATGLLLQARLGANPRGGFQSWRLSDDAVLDLMRTAYSLRGLGESQRPPTGDLGRTQQGLLRAVGRVMDDEHWRELRLVAQPTGLIIQVLRARARWRGFHTYRISADQLTALLESTPPPHGQSAFGEPIGVTAS
ncbi:MAG: hypothetical protein ACTHMP_23095 [Thermomicrobiales bacterium]